jgi:enoyl-CoA hydratase
VTVDNAAKLNTLNRALMGELIAAVETLGRDPALRVAVVRGAGERAFIGGADIAEMAALEPDTAPAYITLVHQACAAFRALAVPTVAAIRGYALGAGLELAASCDLRLAAADARFGMPEVRIGIPSVVEAALLPKLIGWGRTRRLLFTGETIRAAQALDWGLVEEVAAPEALDAAVERVIAAILQCGPRAIRLQKTLIAEWEDLPVDQAITRGIDSFTAAWDSDEPRRMMSQFLASMRTRKR